ncbi:MAG: hypothetical protein M1840_005969 [Geoglossum simile]|nr:MAG: hypothetical protein M1840_005969 [Geoglossum simile]
MHFTKTSAFGLAISLASSASAHMFMANPVPFKSQMGSNGPLDPTGINFPCKGDTAYDRSGITNSWPIGSTQTLKTLGQAVHGGGSCQISITYDLKPTKDSVWKVIHSIIGNCPTRNQPGNIGGSSSAPNPDTYDFKIPADLKAGEAIAAWTWFNKVGNPEMYMNCAPVTITGGSSKRDEALVARDYNSLPNMFKANISPECKTSQTGFCVVFPNPGQSVEKNAPGECKFGTNEEQFTGDCVAFNGGSASSSPNSPAPSAPAPNSPAASAPAPSAPAASAPAPSSPASSSPSHTPTPGIFVAPPTPSGNNSNTCSTADYGKTICSSDGTLIGICDYGGKIVMGQVAAGTKCVNGAMVAARDAGNHIRARRHSRFS